MAQGVYFLQPDPGARPFRVKIGWSKHLDGRIEKHLTLNPELRWHRKWHTEHKNFEYQAQKVALAFGGVRVATSRDIFDLPRNSDIIDRLCQMIDAEWSHFVKRMHYTQKLGEATTRVEQVFYRKELDKLEDNYTFVGDAW